MAAKNDVKIQVKDMDRNYPLYVLSRALDFAKDHLRSIKRTRKTHPNFYFPDAEEVVKCRILELRKTIKKIK